MNIDTSQFSNRLSSEIDSLEMVAGALEDLFDNRGRGRDDTRLNSKAGYSESKFLLTQLKEIEDSIENGRRELINYYSLGANQYLTRIGIYDSSKLRAIVSLIAWLDKTEFTFSSPIKYRTRYWKNKKIGNVNYIFQGKLDEIIARKFDKKSSEIARKFGMDSKKLSFYKCENYENAQYILGIDFDTRSAGKVQSSEAFDDTIITGVNSENFEHDVFHMYIETKFPDDSDRNFIAEEGYANSIADAYYAKKNGEIISRYELVRYLKEYIGERPDTDILRLFEDNPKIFLQLKGKVSDEVFDLLSVQSTITSLICDDVELRKGMSGLIKLLRSGQGKDAFFVAVNKLIALNKSNFDSRLKDLIFAFRE